MDSKHPWQQRDAEMASAREVERCPECWHEGYSYDPVCKIWCCGRCQRMETVEEKDERDGRWTALSAPGKGAAEAPARDEGEGAQAALRMRGDRRSRGRVA